MTIKTAIIGAATALSIAASSVAVPVTANAAPFASFKTAEVETQAAGVEEVGRKRRRRGRRHHRGVNPGAAAAIGVGALILGAAIAGAANAGPRCRTVRVRRWSNRHAAYVIRRQRVCN